MTTLQVSLIVRRGAIPSAADVARRCADHGQRVSFPRGFEFDEPDQGPWIPITLDGVRTGFDVGLSTVALMAGEDPESAARLGKIGSHLLTLGARGRDSMHAVVALVGAISELSGTAAWVEDEVVPADDVPQFLAGIAAAEEQLQAAIAALPSRSKAEQDAAFRRLEASRGSATDGRWPLWGRIVLWVCIYAGIALAGWFIALR